MRTEHGHIIEEESWKRNHGGGVMEYESWWQWLRRNHGTQNHPEGTQRAAVSHPKDTQDAPRKHPGGTKKAPKAPEASEK